MKKLNNKLNSNSVVENEITTSGIRKSYDADFKKQVLEVWHSGAYESAADCARNYGINENTLYESPPASRTQALRGFTNLKNIL